MNRRLSSTVLLALVLSWTALAQTQPPMREGNWEVTMKMSMAGINMELPETKQTHCVTADMIKDPQGAVPKGIGGSDCKVSDYKFAGSTATYTVACTTPAPVTAVGQTKYNGAEAYTGTLSMDSNGQKMSIAYDAKRIGDCPK